MLLAEPDRRIMQADIKIQFDRGIAFLKGFVPIRPEWKTVSHMRLWAATCRALGEEDQLIIDAEASESEDTIWDY